VYASVQFVEMPAPREFAQDGHPLAGARDLDHDIRAQRGKVEGLGEAWALVSNAERGSTCADMWPYR